MIRLLVVLAALLVPQLRFVVGNLNSGRSKRGVGAVERTLTEWRDKALDLADTPRGADLPIILFTEEMDEGDKTRPTDHQLLKRIFGKPWRRTHMSTRTPILLRGFRMRQPRRAPVVARYAGRPIQGVPRWSPYRTLVEGLLAPDRSGRWKAWWNRRRSAEPPIVVLGMHYPAGSRNGRRPQPAKRMLDLLYDAGLALHRARIAYHHKLGRHVAYGMDTNNRHFPRMHKAEVAIATSLPDYIRFTPAPGWGVRVRNRTTTRNHFEPFHKGLLAVVETYEKGK